jgi:hypothetical protein
LLDQLGHNVLVNKAGVSLAKPFVQLDRDDFDMTSVSTSRRLPCLPMPLPT